MAKTNPIGVRFDEDLLAELKKEGYADSPQKALNLLETFYKFSKALNSSPITNKEIYKQPLEETECLFEIGNLEIQKQIQEIKNEKIPPERNTSSIARYSWKHDQEKRISELRSKLI